MRTENSITRCNMIRNKPSYQDWIRQPRRREKFPSVVKKSETPLISHLEFPPQNCPK